MRRPLSSSTATIRRRPSQPTPVSSTTRPSSASEWRPAGTRRRAVRLSAAPPRAVEASASEASGAAAAPASSAAIAERLPQSRRAWLSHVGRGRLGVRQLPEVGARREPGDQRGGDDRARRGAYVATACARVEAAGLLQAGEQCAHPRLAKRPACAEHECVGSLHRTSVAALAPIAADRGTLTT